MAIEIDDVLQHVADDRWRGDVAATAVGWHDLAMTDHGPLPTRSLGVLLHPSSLPGRDAIGTLGAEAHQFVDWLATTGAKIWQILPLSINGKDDSPYFSSSAFAGNPWMVDLDHLVEHGLLDGTGLPDQVGSDPIDFDHLRQSKQRLLLQAADRFLAATDHAWRPGYDEFLLGNEWLVPTCHFLALKDQHGPVPWWEWPEQIRRGEPDAVVASRGSLADEIARWSAMLYFFEVQWSAVRAHAAECGIRILGDIPIYVAPDSADVWLDQEQFQLDDDGGLVFQSGVPPDYFSETGQLWGNPLYRWDVMAADGYSWWIERLRRCLEMSDIVRIDHFRALSAYWEVPGDAETAIGGRWVAGPAQDFIDAIREAFPDMPFVAEDLGDLDDDVYALRDDNRLPGMRVMQFGFDGDPDNPHFPEAFIEACLAYTGTHDNNTTAGWWTSIDDDVRANVVEALELDEDADIETVVWSMIEAALASQAAVAVVPVQDLLVLGDEARMNVPGTTVGNWSWRLPPGLLTVELAATIRSLAVRHHRI
jgi:4-alpha-glucanotransferase